MFHVHFNAQKILNQSKVQVYCTPNVEYTV